MEDFSKRVIKIIKQIPKGKIMTYGQIAHLAGSPRGARQVVRILHSSSKKYNLPWHRVINAKGEIAMTDEEQVFNQRLALENEGIEFISNKKLDVEEYRYHPKNEF